MTLRPFIFWPHLAAGVLAGSIILIMSVTGVLLTYEKQMLAWADGRTHVEAPPGSSRLPAGDLLSRVAAATGSTDPSAVTVYADPDRAVLVTAGQRALLVDPYSGAVLGESAPRLRRFFRIVTDWHRWLAMSGDGRQTGRTITAWSNLLFLFIVTSGIYLWLPRRWSWKNVKAVAVFNRRLSGKARDFNWHNAIGIWCAVPLFLVVISITPVSFPWANALIYRVVGEEPPAPLRRAPQPSRSAPDDAQPARERAFAELNAAWSRAERQVEGWKSITLRIPDSHRAPLAFTIDQGTGGQPQLRGTLTVNSATGDVERWEPFESLSTGRRVRSIARFLHTGEVLGLAGQTIAGIASLGGVFLVWTGLSLAFRRFFIRARAEERRERTAA